MILRSAVRGPAHLWHADFVNSALSGPAHLPSFKSVLERAQLAERVRPDFVD
jgi:hypothetical protein